ncbi:hypothetical protein [Saccharopolyspora dendranthemae]|uniref:Polyketide cyclase/dehydrase/lipid transport protein n=1 Tax=Saccharopolyspora dendranthemae TaxID=1181886 RepID=A0A561U3L4_9PSEU|nr:hypothetical protein [Saccharopolyspora dendranthemae]TWF93964.1 hypothetical protein FHU35_14246 [Saccharopolyspora dendranthemae]
MTGTGSDLPHVDEHSTPVAASPAAALRAITRVGENAFSPTWAGAVARVLGCQDTSNSGPRPLAAGSTIPGFHVVAAGPRELALVGRHRFSSYALVFRVDELEDGTSLLRAETRALFPGAAGRAYRTAVIGTRGHVLAVRRILASAKRVAERHGN